MTLEGVYKMTKFEVMKQGLSKMTGRTGLKIKKFSPEILMVGGVIGIVGSTVLACRATLKLDEVVNEAQFQLSKIEEVHERINDPELKTATTIPYTDEDATQDRVLVYIQTGAKIMKLYGPAIILGTGAVAAILGSNNILKKRNVAVVAAYKAIEEGFNGYRKRVIEELGVDKDRQFQHGIIKAEETLEYRDEKGAIKKSKEEMESLDPNGYSQYARFFDDGCTNWSKEPEYNLMYLKAQQNFANDLLHSRGHVFLNEVYDSLGIPRTKAGSIVGWVLNAVEEDPNYVDFGMYGLNDTKTRDFINGYEKTILLDFNVDGVIYDLI